MKLENIKPSKLPFWSTVKESYRLSWQNRSEYTKIAGCWFALAFVLCFIYYWLNWDIFAAFQCFDKQQLATEEGKKLYNELSNRVALFEIPIIALTWLLLASIAIAWHRLILRSEYLSKSVYFRVDRPVWHYLGFGLLLSIASGVYVGLATLITIVTITSLSKIVGVILVFVFLIGGIALFVAIVQLGVRLPAIALGLNVTYKETLRRTKGNFFRLTFGSFFCVLSMVPVVILLSLVLPPDCAQTVGNVLLQTLNKLLPGFIVVPITLTFLSLAFRHFFPEEA